MNVFCMKHSRIKDILPEIKALKKYWYLIVLNQEHGFMFRVFSLKSNDISKRIGKEIMLWFHMSKDKCSNINWDFNRMLTFDHFVLLCNLINNRMVT